MPDYKIISPERKRKHQYIAFGLIYAIIVFAVLINASAIFDYWDDNWTYVTLFYMGGVTLFLAVSEKIPDELRKPAIQSIYGFLIATPLFMVIFIALQKGGVIAVSSPLPVYLILPTILYQFAVVASSEEIIFRAAIFRSLYRLGWPVAYIGSSLLFGAFHWAAYGGNIPAVLFAVAMGFFFCLLAHKYNLGVAIAFHGVWNSVLLGAFTFN